MNLLPGNIKFLREERGISQEKLSMLCGWQGSARISNYEMSKRQPKIREIEKIAKILKVSAEDLIFRDCSKDIIKQTLSFLGFPVLPENKLDAWPREKQEILNAADIKFLKIELDEATIDSFAFKLPDDAMEPAFAENSFIIVDMHKKYEPKDYVLARIEENSYVFRQYKKYANNYMLSSLSAVPPILITENIKIIGKIIGHFRYF